MAEISWNGARKATSCIEASERDGTPIIFWVGHDRKEVLRFELSGDCYVRGERVDSNPEVYKALRDWMAKCGVLPSDEIEGPTVLKPAEPAPAA